MAEAQQNAQPDPNALFLEASAKEAGAKAAKAEADTVKVYADAELIQAKTLETVTKTQETQQNMDVQAIETIDRQMQSIDVNPAATAQPPEMGAVTNF